ncbi:sulfatase-like hydrolase/transferase, partial [Acidobacteria bacterium AH-259-L09]|nr:sulfatase-like hydrolase/transferase [Acidobacteria bacterium AH-259-L09]
MMFYRRLVSILAALFILASALVSAQSSRDKWNVVLITVDTLRADHLEAYGYKKVRTPNINRLATQGAVFEDVVAPVPLTLPSHASILTGVYPLYHGIRDNAGFVLEDDQITLAEILSANGFATGAFVGSFVLDSRFGLDQGFDTYFADFQLTGMEVIAPGYIQRKAEEVEKRATEWLNKQVSRGQPFFCWIHFYDPHAPYDPPEPFSTRYRNRLYDGEIAYVDTVLGKLLDFLKDAAIHDETMVILTSDHGESLGEHQEKTHGYYIYQATQHVPLIWVTPDRRFAGKRVGGTVGLIDIAPSILQILGIHVPEVMQGVGLLKALLGGDQPHRDLYAESFYARLRFGWSELRGFYRHPYKYIEAPKPELYNLRDDPQERENLYEKNRSIANSLRKELMETIDRYSLKKADKNPQKLDPDVVKALAALGYVSLRTGRTGKDRSYLDLPDPKEKIDIFNKATETYTLIRTQKFSAALKSLLEILAEDPKAVFVFHLLGTVYSKTGKHQKAVEAFRKAAQAFPQDSMLFFNMGNSYLRLGKWTEAAKAFEKVLSIDPSHFRAQSNLATLWLQQGHFEKALTASEMILKKHPEYEPALFNAGLSRAALGQSDRAIIYLKRVVSVNPRNAEAYQYLGQLYMKKGESQT